VKCLNRPAIEAETSSLQVVSSVAGPAVPLYWGPCRRHFSRCVFFVCFGFCILHFTWKFKCLTKTHLCFSDEPVL